MYYLSQYPRRFVRANMLLVATVLTIQTCFLLTIQTSFLPTVEAFTESAAAAPNLPFGDLNVLVVTDVHSWIAGHKKNEPTINADYGDLVSFHEQLQRYCEENEKDYWFVMNGDWIDGTGLSLNGDVSNLIPLLEKMPWDIVNTGNHELYKSKVIEYVTRPGGFIDWWGDRHVSSNILLTDTEEPLSNLYTVLEGKHSRVLVFGFIYNLPDPSEMVTIQHVEDAVQESWFIQALEDETYDAIMVMAHMGTDDPSVNAILTAIRTQVGNLMPVQFITGHTHIRRSAVVDELSASVEAGKYLDTIGFVSFPRKDSVDNVEVDEYTTLFQHTFIDANIESMTTMLGVGDLTTPYGKEVSTFIQNTRDAMGLNDRLGCYNKNLYENRTLDSPDSLWRIYKEQVVPTQLEKGSDINRAILLSQASWRYDIFAGQIIYDDIVAVSPFNEPVYFLGKFKGSTVEMLTGTLNEEASSLYYNTLPAFILSGTVDPKEDCELYSQHFELESIRQALRELDPELTIEPVPTNLTSTNIWSSFVREQWPCPGDEPVPRIPFLAPQFKDGDSLVPNSPVLWFVFGGIVLFVCLGLFMIYVILDVLCCSSAGYDDFEVDALHEGGDVDEVMEMEGEFA